MQIMFDWFVACSNVHCALCLNWMCIYQLQDQNRVIKKVRFWCQLINEARNFAIISLIWNFYPRGKNTCIQVSPRLMKSASEMFCEQIQESPRFAVPSNCTLGSKVECYARQQTINTLLDHRQSATSKHWGLTPNTFYKRKALNITETAQHSMQTDAN